MTLHDLWGGLRSDAVINEKPEKFIDFMRRLLNYIGSSIFLITNNIF